jgi:hypothetical protein
VKFLTPKSVRSKLCKALLLPHFFYCDIVSSSLSCLDGRCLQEAFNSCTRYVFGIRRFDHLSVHRDVLLGMPLFVYFDFRVLSFFRLIRSERPRYLYSDLCRVRSSRTGNLIFPNVCAKGSVLVRGIRL